MDSSIDALYDAAKDIATSAQSDIDSMNSSYPTSKYTRTSVLGSETISTAVASGQTSASQSDSVRMPLTVKEEKPDDIPYMVLDDPNVLDPEVHVKTLEHDNSQSFGLDGSASYSSDMPSASASFTGLQVGFRFFSLLISPKIMSVQYFHLFQNKKTHFHLYFLFFTKKSYVYDTHEKKEIYKNFTHTI